MRYVVERNCSQPTRREKEFGSLLFLIELDKASASLRGQDAPEVTGQLLRDTFRRSDVVRQVQAGHFAVLARSASPSQIDKISTRLWSSLDSCNRQRNSQGEISPISLTVSVLPLGPTRDLSFEVKDQFIPLRPPVELSGG